MRLDDETVRVIENAIELASDCLEQLQEHCRVGRDALIRHCIIPWAIEAEDECQKRIAEEEVPYYESIVDFGAKKLREEIGHETKSLVAG